MAAGESVVQGLDTTEFTDREKIDDYYMMDGENPSKSDSYSH